MSRTDIWRILNNARVPNNVKVVSADVYVLQSRLECGLRVLRPFMRTIYGGLDRNIYSDYVWHLVNYLSATQEEVDAVIN